MGEVDERVVRLLDGAVLDDESPGLEIGHGLRGVVDLVDHMSHLHALRLRTREA
jgi:hypothetical protein